jgi:hypothetical protein
VIFFDFPEKSKIWQVAEPEADILYCRAEILRKRQLFAIKSPAAKKTASGRFR